MRKHASLLLCLFFCLPTFASKHPDPAYQDGVLKAFRTEQHGSTCSTTGKTKGTLNADSAPVGNSSSTTGSVDATTSSTTDCAALMRTYYTIAVGEHVFVVTPDRSIKEFFHPYSDLYGALPGTTVKIRTDGGKFFVRIGKRESQFAIVSAE